MSILTISVLVGALVMVIGAFFVSLFTTEKVDLDGRYTKEEVERLISGGVRNLPVSGSRFGRFYNRFFGKRVTYSIQKNAQTGIVRADLAELQKKIELLGLQDKTSAVEIVMKKYLGLLSLLVLGVPAIISKQMLWILIAMIVFLSLYLLPQSKLEDAIKEREDDIVMELPGFIEQVYMCIESGAELKYALNLVAAKYGGVLGKAFQEAFRAARISGDWIKELLSMAQEMKVEALQEFITDITVAYEKGNPLAETLRDEVKHINMIRKARNKDIVQALPNKLLLPITFFVFLPMLMLVIFPTIIQALVIVQ